MSTRIATSTIYSRNTSYLQNLNNKMNKYEEQYQTGQRYKTASEAPSEYGAAMRMTSEIAMYEQYSDNAGYAYDNLSIEETSLSTINSRLDRAKTLMQSAVNGSYSKEEHLAIAAELEQIQKEVLDLMNSQTALGEYVFSGSKSDTPAFTLTYDQSTGKGKYVYQGDNGQREIQASPSVKVAVSDSGLGVFQKVATAKSIKMGDDNDKWSYSNYDEFTKFFDVECENGTGDWEARNKFVVTDYGNGIARVTRNGSEYENLSIDDNGHVNFHGIDIAMDGKTTVSFRLEKPSTDNVLNSIQDAIDALKDESVTGMDAAMHLQKAQINLSNVQTSINTTLSAIGGRQNVLQSTMDSNEQISDVKKENRANIAEVDMFEASSNLLQVQSNLQMAMKSFTMITQTSLFDYI